MSYSAYRNAALDMDVAKFRTMRVIGVILLFSQVFFDAFGLWRLAYLAGWGIFAGFILLCVSSKRLKLAKRCKIYAALLMSDACDTLPKLAVMCGRRPSKFMEDLTKMVRYGYFPPEVLHGGFSFIGAEAPEAEPAATGVSEADAVLERGRAFVARISVIEAGEANRATRAKINDARLAATAIFEFIYEHPEAAPSLAKFMDYTLPEAVKLLSAYQSVANKEVMTEHMRTTAEAVLESLDAIIAAMREQLDALYRDMATATKADADVYRSMAGNSPFSSGFGGGFGNA